MALTKEILSKNVDGLTDEQVQAIETLSQNAFQEAISQRIGEIHGQYDQDISSVTGQTKPGGVKTYEWLKNVLSDYKTKAESGAGDLEKYQTKISELESKLKDGKGNETLVQQLKDLEAQKTQLQEALESTKSAAEEKVKQERAAAAALKINYEFEKALTGVKFKPDEIMPEAVRQTYIDAAKAKILNTAKPDWIDDGQGGQRLVFRNEAGQVLNNPDNALNPYTARELLMKEIEPVLDLGKQQNGGGTKPGKSGGGSFALGGAKNQPEAAGAIQEYLLGMGYENASEKYQAEFDKIWEEAKVSDLPMR